MSSPICDYYSSPSSSFFLPSEDRRSLRRRPFGDDRLHRRRRAEVGPELCQRRLDPFHSFPNAVDFIGPDGAPKIGQEELKRMVPALAEDPLNLSNFGVPYSLNRRQRWELPEHVADQLTNYQNPLKGLRFSAVVQKCNSLHKGTLNGRKLVDRCTGIGRMDESAVSELHTFDAGREIHRQSKSARGANTLAQLLQKGPKPKKPRNRRAGRIETAGEKQRWLDLFEPQDYSVVNPSPRTTSFSAKKQSSREWTLPPVHTYYNFRLQPTSRHQLNSDWQQGYAFKPLLRAETREGGHWREEVGGGEVWEQLSRRQMALMSENGAIAQKRRDGPFAKGAERFAIEADLEEYMQQAEPEEMDDLMSELEMEADEQTNNEQQKCELQKNTLADYLVTPRRAAKNKLKGEDGVAKAVGSHAIQKMENRMTKWTMSMSSSSSSSSSGLGIDEFEDEGEEEEEDSELWELSSEFGATLQLLEELGQIEEMWNSSNEEFLPNTRVFKPKKDSGGDLMVELEGELVPIPAGSLLIARKSSGETGNRYLLNPPPLTHPKSPSRDKIEQQHSATSSVPQNKLKDSAALLMDILGPTSSKQQPVNNNNNKSNNWFVDNEPLMSDAEADEKAVQLVFEGLNGRKLADGTQQLCAPSTSSGHFPSAQFCGVCFAECFQVEGFALPECHTPGAQPQHFFCDYCWRRHIQQCLASGQVPITCMAIQCPTVLHPQYTLLVTSQSTGDCYRRLLARRRRMRRDFIACGQCDGILRLLLPDGIRPRNAMMMAQSNFDERIWLTHCGHCGNTICTRCAQRQHLPLNCEERELYEQILHSNGQSLRYLRLHREERRLASGVRCGNCNNLVEKTTGCDHISCHCGHQFCWRCGGIWPHKKECPGNGRINVPLFDLVFVNGPHGRRRLAKSPEKFFAECAQLRALRSSQGRQLHKQMHKIFPASRHEARQWMEKYLQLSEFVELCLVKRLLGGHNKFGQFGNLVDRLRFTFCAIPFVADVRRKAKLEQSNVDGETVERYYSEMAHLCRRIVGIARMG